MATRAKTQSALLVPAVPPDSEEAHKILVACKEPGHPFKVTFSPKWTGNGFTGGTVVCQHGRHKTLEGATRCAAAHRRALTERRVENFSLHIEAAPSVLWTCSDGRRWPREAPAGE
jgi:hypothetical protein